MASLKADLQQMRQVYEEFAEEERSLKRMIEELEQLTSGILLAWKGDAMLELRRKIRKQTDSLETRRRKLRRMMETLESIVAYYEDCEARLADEAVNGNNSASQQDITDQIPLLLLPHFGTGLIQIDWRERIIAIDF